MKSLYDISAPAKLNLFLHVVGRRSDGYHLLESVFRLIDWCDTLHFEVRHDGQISREDLNCTLPEQDLIIRAARSLQQFSGTPLGAHIGVQKSIPTQAGLGGGSSDAASTLLALNRLWRLGLERSSLMSIGLQLGADVPFFLGGNNAFVSGIGENLRPIALPPAQYLVIKPSAGLDTGRIFSHPGLKRDSETTIISGFAANADLSRRNDLQEVARSLCPDIDGAIDWLASKGLSGRMTGSGSAVFAELGSGSVLENVPDVYQVRVCDGLAAHPLLGWAV
jgi:4-diphosphocytidyl-2-C-methyl-D-erythritol kinase